MRARKQFPANFRSFVTLFQALSNISVRAIEIIRKHNYEIEEKKSRCVRKEKIENLHRRSSQSPKYVDKHLRTNVLFYTVRYARRWAAAVESSLSGVQKDISRTLCLARRKHTM